MSIVTAYNNYINNIESIDQIRSKTAMVAYATTSSDEELLISTTIAASQIQSADLKKIFQELAKKWREETSGSSSPLEKVINDNYLMIIKKGTQNKEIIVPLILKELEKEPNFWFKALRLITEEDPVKPEEFNSYKLVTKAWLSWGKEKGYL
jgi:hypothetical protein